MEVFLSDLYPERENKDKVVPARNLARKARESTPKVCKPVKVNFDE